jgi:4-carboxymuconolactone decarboxylase
MLDGLENIADASPKRKRLSLRMQGGNAHTIGRRILERIYGGQTSKLLRHLDDLYPGLGHRITQEAYGLIMNRGGLTLRDRELVNVVVLYVHGFKRQLYSHLRGALRVGVSKTTLRSVVLLAANVVGKDSRQALATLDRLHVE